MANHVHSRSTKDLASSLNMIRKSARSVHLTNTSNNEKKNDVNINENVAPKSQLESSDIQLESSRQPSCNNYQRQFGQCTICRRCIGLTQAGVLFKHGQHCSGSGQLPVSGTVTKSRIPTPIVSQVTCSLPDSIASSVLTNSHDSLRQLGAGVTNDSLMQVITSFRCRILKRIPRGSRTLAAEKLSSVLIEINSNPESVNAWNELLVFGKACLQVPGQRGGKRHAEKLTSKENQALAAFPHAMPHHK